MPSFILAVALIFFSFIKCATLLPSLKLFHCCLQLKSHFVTSHQLLQIVLTQFFFVLGLTNADDDVLFEFFLVTVRSSWTVSREK